MWLQSSVSVSNGSNGVVDDDDADSSGDVSSGKERGCQWSVDPWYQAHR